MSICLHVLALICTSYNIFRIVKSLAICPGFPRWCYIYVRSTRCMLYLYWKVPRCCGSVSDRKYLDVKHNAVQTLEQRNGIHSIETVIHLSKYEIPLDMLQINNREREYRKNTRLQLMTIHAFYMVAPLAVYISNIYSRHTLHRELGKEVVLTKM